MDTLREIRADEWWQDHLGGCGTCYWKDRGYCSSGGEKNGEEVDDNDSCDDWIEGGVSMRR